jgi:hypothetical protein
MRDEHARFPRVRRADTRYAFRITRAPTSLIDVFGSSIRAVGAVDLLRQVIEAGRAAILLT